jgi:rRNA maturation RNase YbeY
VSSGSVGVVFVGSRRCRRINREWLGHDEVTDVITFPLGEGGALEGEVYVNLDRARTQARDYGVPEQMEVARLVAHGVLHLAGHDDRRPADARRMRAAEDRVLSAWRR